MAHHQIAGQLAVAQVFEMKDSDGFRFDTVTWGYDTLEDAMRAIPRLAQEEGIPESELVVLRPYFTHDEEYEAFMRSQGER